MKALGCLFVFLFAMAVVFFMAVRNILAALFGRPKKGSASGQDARRRAGEPHREDHPHQDRSQGKIFDKDEGEYVDFEEIKK